MIDLNRATLDELLELPDIDHAKAYDIVLWRPYLSWAELEGAPSLTHEDVDRLRASGAHVGLPSTSAWPTYSTELARRD
jgi:DNA uptake protein ComE-like DNA-binding protein